MQNRMLLSSLMVLLVLLTVPCPAIAGTKFQPAGLIIEVLEPSDELVYLDILVPKNQPHIDINHINDDVLKVYPVLEKTLRSLDSDGFVSYSLFYINSYPDLLLRSNATVRYFAEGQLNTMEKIKIVTMNQDGAILKISDVLSIKPDFLHLGGVPSIQYHYAGNTARVDFKPYFLPFWALSLLSLVCFGFPAMILSNIIKVLASLPFKMRPILVISKINFLTQGAVALTTPFLTALLPFAAAFSLTVISAAALEYMVYLRRSMVKSKVRTVLYVMSANSLSILINLYIFGSWYGFF